MVREPSPARFAAILVALLFAATVVAAQPAIPCLPDSEAEFSYTGDLQSYDVPAGAAAVYIDILGAAGGTDGRDVRGACCDGGNPASLVLEVPVDGGETLDVLVGGAGESPDRFRGSGSGGGGGGSFVWISGPNTLLAAAGGGGGAGASDDGGDASLSTTGNPGNSGDAGAGGSAGSGGGISLLDTSRGGGGGGWLGEGDDDIATGGGGDRVSPPGTAAGGGGGNPGSGSGGYGGGGGAQAPAGGGGGGYSGGGGGIADKGNDGGGGGGSFASLDAVLLDSRISEEPGDGAVAICALEEFSGGATVLEIPTLGPGSITVLVLLLGSLGLLVLRRFG